jgi:arginine deiminase
MWTVKSESGPLKAVLIQESIEQFWNQKLPFIGVESNTLYLPRCPHADLDGGREQWNFLPKLLEEEGVRVFEVKSILKKALDNASLKERKDIINVVWGGMLDAPEPKDLRIDHLFSGYPSKPYYDKDNDRVVLPDFQRVSWPYPRDTSFTTQIGTVICNMRRYSRRFEPRVVRLCYDYESTLKEKIDVIFDANELDLGFTEPLCIEGGDTHILDEETIAIGLGQRSTFTGFIETAKRLFDADNDKEIKHILAVKMPDYPASDYMHLDVIMNYPKQGNVLVMPYFFESDLIKDMPSRKLLLKLMAAVRAASEADNRPMDPVVHPQSFKEAGCCTVYSSGKRGPKILSREKSLLDYLIKQGKLEADGIIYVGGNPENENSLEHLMLALMEQARGASNIVTLKPGVVIAYERNHVTNDALKDFGITVKTWPDSYLDLLGGPHCSTSPLWRDSS